MARKSGLVSSKRSGTSGDRIGYFSWACWPWRVCSFGPRGTGTRTWSGTPSSSGGVRSSADLCFCGGKQNMAGLEDIRDHGNRKTTASAFGDSENPYRSKRTSPRCPEWLTTLRDRVDRATGCVRVRYPVVTGLSTQRSALLALRSSTAVIMSVGWSERATCSVQRPVAVNGTSHKRCAEPGTRSRRSCIENGVARHRARTAGS